MQILTLHPAIPPMLEAVRAAGRICRTVQAALVTAGTLDKSDRSPVTVADFASQAIVSRILGAHLPDLPLVGEEKADALRREENAGVLDAVVSRVAAEWEGAERAAVLDAIDRGAGEGGAGRTFTLDPIDGTKGFLRGDQYAVALALLEEGRVVAGVLGCPNLPGPDGSKGCIFVAVRGKGAVSLPLSGEGEVVPVAVSTEDDPTRTRFCESVEKAHSNKGRSADVARILGVTAPPVPMDSQCKYGLVCRGDAELYLRLPTREDYREKIWDHAAGSIVVEEAGGTVTDIHGKPLDFTHGRRLTENRGVVATNGRVHDAVIAAIAKTE